MDTQTASQFFHLHKYFRYTADQVPLFSLCACTTNRDQWDSSSFQGARSVTPLRGCRKRDPHLLADWSGALKRLHMSIAYVRWCEEKPLLSLATGRWQLKHVLAHLSVCTCVLWLWEPGKACKPQLMTKSIIMLLHFSQANEQFASIQDKKELISDEPQGNDPGPPHIQRSGLAAAVWYLGQNQLGRLMPRENCRLVRLPINALATHRKTHYRQNPTLKINIYLFFPPDSYKTIWAYSSSWNSIFQFLFVPRTWTCFR